MDVRALVAIVSLSAEMGVARGLRVACSQYVGGFYIGESLNNPPIRQYKFSANISSYTVIVVSYCTHITYMTLNYITPIVGECYVFGIYIAKPRNHGNHAYYARNYASIIDSGLPNV